MLLQEKLVITIILYIIVNYNLDSLKKNRERNLKFHNFRYLDLKVFKNDAAQSPRG